MSKNVEVKNVTEKKVVQPYPKMVPVPEQLYQLEEFQNGFTKITEILDIIKVQLKIVSFLSFANYLENTKI